MCYVSYFINSDGRKLTAEYIFELFILSGTKFCIFIFQGYIYQRITYLSTKATIYPIPIHSEWEDEKSMKYYMTNMSLC